MKESAARTGVLMAVTLLLTACAGLPTRSDHDPATSFAALNTFTWLEPTHDAVDDPLLDSQLLSAKVHRAVVAALESRGYRQVGADADFLVTYHTTSRERLRDPAFSVGFGFGRGFYNRGHHSIFVDRRFGTESYQEGTLIIDIIDAQSSRLIWRGWLSSPVSQERFTDAAIERYVRTILEAFPPQ